MENLKLAAEPRKLVGKQVKKLRREGLIPANLFGKGIKSESVQVRVPEFSRIWKKAGETTLVDLSLGASKSKPVLIKAVQRGPVDHKILHVDFQQVNLKEKISTSVPLVLEGESPTEKSGTALVLQTLAEVAVEALPTEIPHDIKVDVSKLTEIGQTITVKDLKVPKEVEVKTPPETVIISVQTAEMKEEVVEEAPSEPEVIAEKPEEPAEGEEAPETPSQDEKPKEETS